MTHELMMAFDPGDPDTSDAEFAEQLKQLGVILQQVSSDQVVWLLEMSGKAKARYQQVNWACFEEMQRRKPLAGLDIGPVTNGGPPHA